MFGHFIVNRVDTATDPLTDPPITSCDAQMFVACNDLFRHLYHLLRTYAGIQTQIAKRAIEAVDVLLEPEGAAVEGARHVEGAVAVLPTAVTKRDQHLILGHELAIHPGEPGIAKLCHGCLCYLNHHPA